MATQYRRVSWVDPRIFVGSSAIQGRGLFVSEQIEVGEVVVIWGGVLMTREDIWSGRAKEHSIAEVDEGLVLASERSDPESPADLMNHSCDPNVWMDDEVTLIARRTLHPGDEAAIDYALWGGQPPWSPCRCGSALCRSLVTADDWRRSELQERYGTHWSPYILRRIEQSRS